MRRTMLAALAVTGLMACGRGSPDVATVDSTGRDIALAPAGGGFALGDRPVVITAAATRTLDIGSRIDATWGEAISSRSNKAGETVTINVGADVKDNSGRVVIPAGSTVDLRITTLTPATNRSQADGSIVLSVTSATIRGREYALQGDVTSVTHWLKSRGVGTAEVVKVGVGTAVGAAAGQVIAKNTKGTVIGGAVGAAAGAAAAVQTASRDVVVSTGAPVVITLTGPLTVSMK